ncbi:hypothetical protein MWU75_02720 [Ornithinimicrobium sp. F0845]|uniref:hypothetical protein n=1 Tax=Ornithinimicrobium sp. F0845 TaxID=2926412 RepID=UPI001FF5D16F|nr:hypothetical protein [Ornithinimicrobium sp. F0845]MCK0111055.1 hypothetical protein [Ornithinimicrobium sp. F0845]
MLQRLRKLVSRLSRAGDRVVPQPERAADHESGTHEGTTAQERQLQRAEVERDRAVRESRMRQGQQPESVTYW